MDYQQTIEYLYQQLPSYERQGNSGYKPGLQTSLDLDELFNHPHHNFRIIHVGGTNGKGSVSHLLAATLQLNGYRMGLYTSPHIIDFRERIKVNGQMIGTDDVLNFMKEYFSKGYEGHPSFFELTTEMAFDYFSRCKVDIAVVEVGLGGRLDSTNIVSPMLSIITNISLDHTSLLGDTVEAIATEKAGIIKRNTPVIIGESGSESVVSVFQNKAKAEHSPITFADRTDEVSDVIHSSNGALRIVSKTFGEFQSQLSGAYQVANITTWLCSVKQLRELGIDITDNSVREAGKRVCDLTGFMGRWTVLRHNPTFICDAAHNLEGVRMLKQCLQTVSYHRLHFIYGVCSDKDIDEILEELPTDATYYFTQACNHRALSADLLQTMAASHHLRGNSFTDVAKALENVRQNASSHDLILIAGSIYLLADFLKIFNNAEFIIDN